MPQHPVNRGGVEKSSSTALLADLTTPPERRAEYLRSGAWDDSTLVARVAQRGRTRATDVAVVDRAGRHTYGQLADDAAGVATALRERGVRTRDVVSIQLPNWYETAVLAVAAQSLGAVLNPLLPDYRARELGHVFTTARPVVIATPAIFRDVDHRPLVDEVIAATGVAPLHIVVGEGAAGGGGRLSFEALRATAGDELGTPDAAAISEIIFTSGTEATPKAIMHTEQTTNFSARVAHSDLGLGPEDVVWMASPVGHSTGFNYGIRFALYHGLKLVLQERWSADVALQLLEAEGCTYTLAATTFLQDVVNAAQRDGRSMRFPFFGCGGAPVPPLLVDAAAAIGIGALRLYGSTEVLVATWNRHECTERMRRETDGPSLSGIEVEVRTDGGALAPRGEAGEIFVRGPDTCVGFFADPERTAATFHDGWVRSGDVATMDEDACLTIVGRKKEIIIRGGMNIAPREIEDLLLQFPEVQRAAIIGLPDERLGERVCACLVLIDGVTLDLTTVTDRLRAAGCATYKLPQVLKLIEEMPTTASGKIQKHELVKAVTSTDDRVG